MRGIYRRMYLLGSVRGNCISGEKVRKFLIVKVSKSRTGDFLLVFEFTIKCSQLNYFLLQKTKVRKNAHNVHPKCVHKAKCHNHHKKNCVLRSYMWVIMWHGIFAFLSVFICYIIHATPANLYSNVGIQYMHQI